MSLTDEHVLAAYVDGSDLDAVAPVLRAAFTRYASSSSWLLGPVVVVDQRRPPDPAFPDALPDWDLGVNLGLDKLPQTPGWFVGVESLVGLLRQLAQETGRDFVLFMCFQSQLWRQEHLTFVGADAVDLPWLRGAIERLRGR